jgi:hypothetical protein
MRANLWSLIFWLAVSFPAIGQETAPAPDANTTTKVRQAYEAGEWFRFRIHYGIFNTSFATIELIDEKWDDQPVFHARAIGKTTGLARLFFKVDDYYDSYFTQDTVRPLYFTRNIDEGGYKKNLNIRFDHQHNKAEVNDLLKNETVTFDIEPDVQDLVSCFYYLRSQFDASTINEGEFISVNLFFDKENFIFKFKFLGTEEIKTKYGRVKALKFRPYVHSGRVFRSRESITLWVSDDDNRIPLRMEADLKVGSIVADLDAFKGLKNQFKIVVPD